MTKLQRKYNGLFQAHYSYEARPYIALFFGAVGIVNARHDNSMASLICGGILVVSGLLLIQWRADYRARN